MRVISGSARGVKLECLEGLETRPTTDRVKEAIFSMIQTHIMGANALDLFSGSGALGIELISRGAQHVTFIENNRHAMAIIEKNLEKTKTTPQARLLSMDVYKGIENLRNQVYNIIIMDPPYLKGEIKKCLAHFEQYTLLDQEGMIIIEHAINDPDLDDLSAYFTLERTKKYGKIGVSILRRTPCE